MRKTKLGNYINCIELNQKLLEKYPENKDMLEKKVQKAKDELIEYVTSSSFKSVLETITKYSNYDI